ncbi:MAG: alpha/beta hydrolase, partial [Deltaproteobacteria bacterium]
MPLLLKLEKSPKEELNLKIRLVKDDVLDETDFKLESKNLDQPHRVTFVSKIDHSVQYYSIRYPKNYDPQKSYGAIFSLHGAGVEASLLALQYSSKDWAFVITPTNRRP